MKNIDLEYEPYGSGYMIADYSDPNRVRYCGSNFYWSGQPIIYDPFDSKGLAESEAYKHFTGKDLE